MAIPFARIKIIFRSQGFNACQRASYNSNTKIRDHRINKTFYFKGNNTNVYHAIILNDNVSQKFKNAEVLMNEVERCEKRKDSQLLKEYLLALPSEVEISLNDRIELTLRFIQKMNFIENEQGVQVDIHKPLEDESNWYAKILVTTRKFKQYGGGLGQKVIDLGMQFKKTKSYSFIPNKAKDDIGKIWGDVQNNYFQEMGLSLKVDDKGAIPQAHIGNTKYGILAEQNRLSKNLAI